jgi:hypothetical protein
MIVYSSTIRADAAGHLSELMNRGLSGDQTSRIRVTVPFCMAVQGCQD